MFYMGCFPLSVEQTITDIWGICLLQIYSTVSPFILWGKHPFYADSEIFGLSLTSKLYKGKAMLSLCASRYLFMRPLNLYALEAAS